MKTQKLLSLDIELVEKLKKEPNASGVVNDLLKQHYSGMAMSKQAVAHAIKTKKAELAVVQHELEELRAMRTEQNKPRSLAERLHNG
jgi:DNA transposition AAA+ family ATPase